MKFTAWWFVGLVTGVLGCAATAYLFWKQHGEPVEDGDAEATQ